MKIFGWSIWKDELPSIEIGDHWSEQARKG